MSAPDLTELVDVAARAWFDHGQKGRMDAGRKRPDGQLWQWEDLRPIDQYAYRQVVLPVVTAIVDHLREEETG